MENFKPNVLKKEETSDSKLENGGDNSMAVKDDKTIAEKLAMTQKDRGGDWGDLYREMQEKGERLPTNDELEAAAKKVTEDISNN